MEDLEFSYCANGKANGTTTLENSWEVSEETKYILIVHDLDF